MNDIIYRQTAINTLCSKCTVDKPETCSTIQKGDNWCEEVYILQRVPCAQPEQKWIPCSERLPEESGYYIITAHDGVGHRTTFVKYQKKAKSWDLTGARSYWRVIAWMPLPEPHEEGDING